MSEDKEAEGVDVTPLEDPPEPVSNEDEGADHDAAVVAALEACRAAEQAVAQTEDVVRQVIESQGNSNY